MNEPPLIPGYELELFTPPWDPELDGYVAKANLPGDIREVIPYLNAVISGAVYNPEADALTWKEDGFSFGVHPHEVATYLVEDRAEAERVLGQVIERINACRSQREQIRPSHAARQRPKPLELYGLLPRTNCGECGEPTCFTFALKLIALEAVPERCPPLKETAYQPQAAALDELLRGYAGE